MAEAEHKEHKLPLYQTFAALAVLTLIEVLVGYIESSPLIVTILMLLALAKAVLVGAVFMEIAFDKEATKIILMVFVIPFVSVLILILIIWADWRTPLGIV